MDIKQKLRNRIRELPDWLFIAMVHIYYLNWLPERWWININYKKRLGKKMNWEKPTGFNAKLQWLKLYYRNPAYVTLSDKYLVRSYVSEQIGEEYLVPLLGVYDCFEDIDFDSLPNRFVLKCTHDSGSVVVCKDKSQLDVNKTKRFFKRKLDMNYYYTSREWAYKLVEPRIIGERYLVGDGNKGLNDYKFFCFSGEPRCILMVSDRFDGGLKVDFYDTNWCLMPFKMQYPRSGKTFPKPQNYDKMLSLCRILSKDFPFVRVDFYESEGRIYFGELTFYPNGGFSEFWPDEYDEVLGSWLQLPERKR